MGKNAATVMYIPQWCLPCNIVSPSDEDVEAMKRFLQENHDAARLPHIETIAAFATLVCHPGTSARVFHNSDVFMLANRQHEIIMSVLDVEHAKANILIIAFRECISPQPVQLKKAK